MEEQEAAAVKGEAEAEAVNEEATNIDESGSYDY